MISGTENLIAQLFDIALKTWLLNENVLRNIEHVPTIASVIVEET